MRLVVAFDTATDHLAAAIGALDEGDVAPALLAAADFPARRAALGVLLPTVRDLFAAHDLSLGDVAAVAVGRGPGSFTGVRIGVASAKGLAQGLGVPLAGFSTLDAVGWRFRDRRALVAVVGDAMRGEVYPALLRCDGDGACVRLDAERVGKPRAVAEAWAAELAEPMVLTGNGLAKHGAVFAEVLGDRATVADESLWTPTGASLLDAAWAAGGPASLRAIAGLPREAAYAQAHPGALLPVYTRLSDAEEAERERARAAGDGLPGDTPSAAMPPASGVRGPVGGDAR